MVNRKMMLEQRIARLEKSFNKNKRARTFESYEEEMSYEEVAPVIDSLVACAERLRDDTKELLAVQKQLASLQRSGVFNKLSPEDMEAIEEKQQYIDSCLQIVSDSLW
jgi:tRNA 2-selenouridine synthase SelU